MLTSHPKREEDSGFIRSKVVSSAKKKQKTTISESGDKCHS